MTKKNNFENLQLKKTLVDGIKAAGYTQATPVQAKGLEPLLRGKDALVKARTGTGKTALFVIPALQYLIVGNPKIQVLTIAPTRELAAQVGREFQSLGQNIKDLDVATITGGSGKGAAIRRLSGSQVVVATPGRIAELCESKNINLTELQMLVIDEADVMFDMGFRETITKIIKSLPEKIQIVLCSATFTDDIRKFAKSFLSTPITVEDNTYIAAKETMEEWAVSVYPENHMVLTENFIKRRPDDQVLVFCNHKERVDEVAEALVEMGIAAVPLHSGLDKRTREQSMKSFRAGKVQVLVATDVASRGIDIPGLPLVINYDLPYELPDYVHRAGRTARAGQAGLIITYYNGRKERLIRQIESRTSRKMSRRSFNECMNVSKEEKRAKIVKAEGVKQVSVKDAARIFIYAGKRQGVNVSAMRKFLMTECRVKSGEIAFIETEDKYSIIGISKEIAKRVVTQLNKSRFKGLPLKAELRRAAGRRRN